MRIRSIALVSSSIVLMLSGCTQGAINGQASVARAEKAPNGISLPQGYKNWRVIAVSHRTDNETLRAILGNDIAIEASRAGQTNPWPKGAVLGKLVWKDMVREDDWPEATVPGKFLVAEFMLKDRERFAKTGGWGYARWLGDQQKPYGEDASFAQECYACHTPMKDRDYVFTHPVTLP